jgi:cytolysin (calcineurin-like family phosphatase)
MNNLTKAFKHSCFLAILTMFFAVSLQAQPIPSKITNRFTGENLGLQNGTPYLSTAATDTWLLEPTGEAGFVRIKHVASGTYLHNQNGVKLEAGGIQPGWWSAQWTLKSIDGNVQIINRWQNTYIHNEHKTIELGALGNPGWWSAQWKVQESPISAGSPGSFYLIFASDSQWAWTSRTDKEDKTETEAEKESTATILNENHVKSMNILVNDLGTVKGLVLNGDLTAYGNPGEFDKFNSIYAGLKTPMYLGLGNHDYSNNIDHTYENHAGNRMVEFMINHIKSNGSTNSDYKVSDAFQFPSIVTTITGSLAYSWDMGNVHFVQLQNFPIYQREWSNYVTIGAAKTKTVKITASLNWLEQDLSIARKAGKMIILNYHDSDEHWKEFSGTKFGSLSSQFTKILDNYKVGAVFVGHYHTSIGGVENYSSRDVNYGNTPLFYCGSASQSKYLLVNFSGNKMTVENVSSINGIPNRSDKKEYILFNQASTVTPPKPDGWITFFNEAGYVAKYALIYNLDGQEKSFETGNLALGNKKRFEIPGRATNIRIKGEGQTGLVWEPWKTIFNKQFTSAPNQCFKSFGTTLNQKWDNNCE